MDNQMKKCKYCRVDIPKEAKICPNCKKRQGVKIWLIVLIVIAAMIIIGAIIPDSSSSTDNTPSSVGQSSQNDGANSQTSTNEDSQSEKTEFKQSETVSYQGVEYTVTDVQKTTGDEFDQPRDGYEYVIVSVKIENKSEEKISYNPLDWKMENSNGQEESQTFTIIDSNTALSSGDLNPGGNVEGTIAFEQPKGDTGLKLNYYGNIFNENASFKIKID